jgi:integrase
MRSTTATGKASKGSVTILDSNGRLQLRFRVNGKRHYLSTGLAVSVSNYKLAELKAAEIEKDILYERFDPTLAKYKPQSALEAVTPTFTPTEIVATASQKPHLDELWQRYSQFKKPQVSPSTFAKDYARVRNHIPKLPSSALDDAAIIRDYIISHLTPDSAKRLLMELKACCNWAVEEGLIDSNPFILMKFKVPKGLDEAHDINPFSKEERDLIIQTMGNDSYYCHYVHYLKFLFFTGSRPSEAIALKWKNIDNGYVKFREAVVVSESGLVQKEGLKTQRKRDFPITPELQAILNEFKPAKADPEAYLFRSPRGGFVDHHNFTNRAWKKTLAKCGIEYRKSYQTRHTFITLCVEANINTTAIGRWTGTSAKMIDKHYGATNFVNLKPPDLT